MTARPTSPTQARLRAARGARRKALSLEAIVEVALPIVDADGVAAVSMRRVAAEFDTGPARLHVYVANKDELLQHVIHQSSRRSSSSTLTTGRRR